MSDKRFNPQHIAKLDSPERRKAFPPEQILQFLAMKETDDILDLGAGSGYFTIPAAKMTKGTVYALDIEPQMLAYLKHRIEEHELKNVKLIEGQIEDIPMENAKVDRVIVSYVLHEVERLTRGLAEIRRVLKHNGLGLCIDWEKKPMEEGPPEHHRIHSSEMKQALEDAGFRNLHLSFPTDSHYMILFQK